MKTILITGIGGDIAQGVATILRQERPDLYLIGVDMHHHHGGSLFVNECLVVPPARDDAYLEAITDLIDLKGVDVFIPMTELELQVLTPLIARLGSDRCITSGPKVLKAGLDKYETIQSLADFGLPVPWTFPVANGQPKAYPCILKSRFGSGSRAVFTVDNAEDAEYLSRKFPDAIYQELLEPADREVTCAVYRSRQGRTTSLLMLRRLTGGFTGWAQIIEDHATSQMCEVIAEGLDLQGSMNIQLRLTEHGPRVFEINPRFSSTVLMRHKIGFSDVLWAIDEIDGKEVNFPKIVPSSILIRVQDAKVIESIKKVAL